MLTAKDTIARLKARVTLISRKRESNDPLRGMTSIQYESKPIIEQATQEITHVTNQSTLTSFSQQSGVDLNNNIPASVNVPKLHLPTFNGSLLRWPEFWDIFDVSVHKYNVHKVLKFSYLKRALRGSALLPSLEFLLLRIILTGYEITHLPCTIRNI